MIHYIQGIEVKDSYIGNPVIYVPNHAFKGDLPNASHPDCERGHISSYTERTVFVRFRSATGQSCNTKNLLWG